MKLRLASLFLSCLGLVLTAAAADSTSPAARPNILWVVSEDNSWYFNSAYGDPNARTPHFDRIAKDGILFERAYSTSAVCAPTRASIITGMFAPSLGTQHMRSNVPMPPWMRYFPAYLRDAGYFTSNHAKTDYNAAVLPGTWDQNSNEGHWRNRKPGQPFFCVFNFNASHESSLHRRKTLTTDPAKVRVPAYLPDTPEVRKDLAQYYDNVSEADRQIGEVLAELEKDGLADDTIVFYYSDHGGAMTRGKRFMFENGTHPPLAMRFPKKFQHLAPGEPGSRSKELINWVDLAPTVLSLVGVKAPDYFQGRAFAGPDKKPAPEFTYNFRDRMDERYDFCRAVTDGRWRYIRNYRPELATLQHLNYLWLMATTRECDRLRAEGKLTPAQMALFEPKPVEQLFDCQNDPDNVKNLAGDPTYRRTLEKLRAANRAHLLRIRDTGFMPEAILRELAGKNSPYDLGHDDKAYPLARILDVIDRLQLPGTPSESDLRAALKDPLPSIRYWGVISSLRAPEMAASLVTPLLQDSVGSVRVAAASVVAKQGDAAKAWPVFEAALAKNQSAELRLEALNYLTNLPNRPASLRPLYEAAAKADEEPRAKGKKKAEGTKKAEGAKKADAGESRGENYVARAAEYLLTL
jgi:N-sulfoglucosamine sulfohydrolase